MPKLTKTVFAMSVSALLAACGGSNDPGSNSTTTTSTPSSSSPSSTSTQASIPVPSSVTMSAGYSVSVFAQAPGNSSNPPVCAATSPGCYTKADSIVQLGAGSASTVFIAYGGSVQPDGTISSTNTAQGTNQVVQYDLNGNMLKTYTVPGHNDGLLAYDSHTIWTMSNEDANPTLTIIDTTSGNMTTYTADAAPAHGGGIDDMQLINGKVFVSGSNPALDTATGLYDNPAVYTLTLNTTGSTFHLTPVMQGNATATVINPGAAGMTATTSMLGNPTVPNGASTNPAGLQDPDSESIDASGNLVLDSQADSELVFISNPGTANQTVKELFLTLYTNPWPVDDTRWAPASSQFMLVTDTGGLIYKITQTGGFKAGSMYSNGQGTVLQDDPNTGNMTPVATGMNAPHGMLFVQ